MAFVCTESDRAKLFERTLSSFWAEMLSHFTLRLKEQPRPPYAHRDFEQLRLDLPELARYFPVPSTLKKPLMALVCIEMDTAKAFERSLVSFWAEI